MKETLKKSGWRMLAVACVAAATVLMGGGAVAMLYGYQNRIVAMQNEQLASIAQNVATVTELIAREYINDLESLNSTSAFKEADARAAGGDWEQMNQLIASYYEKKRGILGEILVISGPEDVLPDQETYIYRYSMGDTDSGVDIDILVDQNKKCLIGLSKETKYQNRLYYLLDAREIFEQTAAQIQVGEKGYVMIKDSNGRILMHPVEDQIGIDVIADRKERHPEFDFSDLEVLIEKQNRGETGIERYDSYWWADQVPRKVEKISAYTPAKIGDGFLVISAVMDYEEIAGPVRSGAIRLMMMTGAVIVLIVGCGVFLVRNYRRQDQVQRENQKLKEINAKLTEINRQEEKLAHQQRLQTIGTLTGGIAHEFSNLLTPIMGYSAMILQNMEITDENYEDMETIYASSVKAKEIIDQIASFSGKNSQQTFQDLSAQRVVQHGIRMVESVKPRGVEMETELEAEARIYGNPTQIQQILLNLCTNAFHAMQNREHGVLKISTGLTGEKEDRFQILVEDNGCGMTKEVKDQIFDPFFTTKRTGEGTGLGLSVVQRMVESHSGTIEVESEPGKGTRFRLTFPVLKREE